MKMSTLSVEDRESLIIMLSFMTGNAEQYFSSHSDQELLETYDRYTLKNTSIHK